MRAASYNAIIILTLVIASLFIVFSKFDVSTDLNLFLPEPVTKVERLLHYQIDKSASSNIIFLSFSGLATDKLAEFNQRLTSKLRASKTFSRVTNNATTLSESGLEFLERNRYLLTRNDLSKQFSVDGLRLSLQDRLKGLASSTATVEKRYLRNDPTAEIFSLLQYWQGKVSNHRQPKEIDGVWFSDDGLRTLVLLEIATDISQMENQVAAVMEIRSVYQVMKLPGMLPIMAGPAVFAVESGEDIQNDIQWLTLIAVFIVVLFLWGAYGSFNTVFLVVCPLFAGVLVATATILLIYGQIHGITLVFGITLAGVAVDYPIHLLTCIGDDKDKNQSSVKNIWATLKLGVFSTVVAYAAFLVSGFGGLQQLGLFTIVGLVTAAMFSRWVLPLFAISQQGIKSELDSFHQYLKKWGRRAQRLRWIVVVALIISLSVLVFTDRPILHLNVDSLSPIKQSRLDEDKLLRADLGFWYGGSMMIITGKNKDTVLQYSERIESYLEGLVDQQAIDGYDMASHFLPSQLRQAQRKSEMLETETLNANLEEALTDLPFRKNIFTPFIEDVQTAKKMDPVVPGNLINSEMAERLTPLLFEFDDEAGGVILLHGVKDETKIKAFADQHEDLYYMHLKTASTNLVARSVNRVALSILGCIVIIYFCLAIAFRHPGRPLKIMVPTLSAAIVVAAVLVLSGNSLSVFHLISLLLVVGLGLDYALFFNRLPGNESEWDTTFKSLWVCAITTILVFGILIFSQTPPLEAIGKTVGLGAFFSVVFAAMWATTPESSIDS